MTQTHNLQRMLLLALASTTIIGAPIHAQSAILWRTEDGGNGHYYAVNSAALTWSAAQLHAANLGAHVVSITSAEENTFVYTLVEPIPYGSAWLGASAPRGACTDPSAYVWSTGEAMRFSNWAVGEPNGGDIFAGPCALLFAQDPVESSKWNDASQGRMVPSIVEWSADCNNDGMVDYGQIIAGELLDADSNGVPDCCSSGSCQPCLADVSHNGTVDGVDLAAVLGAWETSGKGEFDCDITNDGVVDGADLAFILSGWGACP